MTTVISVHSFRGGTGKSNTTSNLASQLAVAGYRVAVVDTDIQSPGIHVLFGFNDNLENTLNDYLWGNISIVEAAHDVTERLTASSSVKDGGACFLVPSSMKPADIARVLREGYDVGVLNQGFKDLAHGLALDFLMIDTHPGLNEETLLSITISDILILLMRPDRQDFQGTAVTVDVARKLGVPHLLLLVNMVPGNLDADDLKSQLEKVFDADVAAILPLAESVVENASVGLFSLTNTEHMWSTRIGGVAEQLATIANL